MALALLDHFTRNAGNTGTDPNENGLPRYPGHQFTAGLVLYLTDTIVRNKIISDFNKPDGLTVNDQVQLDEMKAVYDAKNVGEKNIYLHTVRACLEQLEQEQMIKSNAEIFLGLAAT